ncbi:MAG: aminopeptidase [Phycisphaerales bacterium]|jgi:aminopeptidase
MPDPRLAKLANVLVRYSTRVKPGDLVTIVAEPLALPAVEAVFEAVLAAGGHPSYHAKPESLQELLVRRGSDAQLQHVCPFEEFRLAKCDVLIVLICPRNTRYMESADPARVAMMRAARGGLLASGLARKAAGESRYVLTEVPSHAAAQDAGMSLAEYTDWVFAAGLLDSPDPASAWQSLFEKQARATDYLARVREVKFQAPPRDGAHGGRPHDGTNLTVNVESRTWINHAGQENFPDGEVETGPRSVDGVVNFTYPSIFQGTRVEGIRLAFRDGQAIEASATLNEAFLIKMLDQDAGARIAGEIALGTNYALTRGHGNTFFDEKIGGTFHLALGAGYPETGNTNHSSLHWDMVCDLRPGGAFPSSPGGTIYADGTPIQRDGKFLLEGWPGGW